MEQNLPILTKKLWNMAKLAFFMLRKGVSKKKLLINNLNLLMKQREDPSHIHYGPTNRNYFTNKVSKNQRFLEEYDLSMASPNFEDIDMKSLDAIDTILETIVISNKHGHVRELSVSDSPFLERNVEDFHERVDEAAEEFIKRFYSQLKEETC